MGTPIYEETKRIQELKKEFLEFTEGYTQPPEFDPEKFKSIEAYEAYLEHKVKLLRKGLPESYWGDGLAKKINELCNIYWRLSGARFPPAFELFGTETIEEYIEHLEESIERVKQGLPYERRKYDLSIYKPGEFL